MPKRHARPQGRVSHGAACMRRAIESLGITASVIEAASSLIPAAWGIADDATLSNRESGYVLYAQLQVGAVLPH